MTPQYRTIAAGAGWRDTSVSGRLRFEGRDAASFLHALVSNDVASLPPGRGVYAALLTPQGRMIADLRLLRDSSRVLAETPAGMAGHLAAHFDNLIFAEQVSVVDETAGTRAVVVAGGRAAEAVAAASGLSVDDIEALPPLGHLTEGELRVIRTDDVALPNFALWMPAGARERISAALAAAGAIEVPDPAAGAPAGLFEALRIEAARPLFGVDMTADTIPLEAGLLDRAISTTKGCYVGQEVIVRILHRGGGRVVRHLVQFLADPGVTEVPAAGAQVSDQGRDVGTVTSAAWGPSSGRVVALGYVHRDSAQVGRVVLLGSGVPATVSAVAT